MIPIPPLGLRLILSWGGYLFSRMPKPSSSFSILFLSVSGLSASSTSRMRLHVRATPMTCLPLPLPSLAPSMMPGRSRTWMVVPFYSYSPGMQVTVVNS